LYKQNNSKRKETSHYRIHENNYWIIKLYLILLSVLMYDINFVYDNLLLSHINTLFTDDSIWRQIEYCYLLRMTLLGVI